MAIKVTSTGQTTFVKKIVVGTPVRSTIETGDNLSGLSDVLVLNPSNSQILIYDSAEGAFKNSDLIAGTGITSTYSSDSDKTTLSITNTGVSAGTYGSAAQIPSISINAQGQIDSASQFEVATTLQITDESEEIGQVDLLTQSLGFSNGIGTTISITDQTITTNIGQDVDIASDVQFNSLTIDGQLYGPSNFIIDPAGIGDNTGKVIIKGDLQVDGTETIINSTTLSVNDKNIILADSAADSAEADGAGITVEGANATITYNASTDKWILNKGLTVSGDLLPSNDSAYDLGSSSQKWKDLHLSGSTIFLGGLRLQDSSTEFLVTDSSGNPVNYDLSGSVDQIRGFFSSGGDLTYDSATGKFSIDVEEIYSAANFDSDLDAAVTGGTGITYDTATNTISVTDTGVVAGEYGSGSEIPVFSVNAQGQIDSIGEVLVSGVSGFTWDSSTARATITTPSGGSFPVTINGFGDDLRLNFGDANEASISHTTDGKTIFEAADMEIDIDGAANLLIKNNVGAAPMAQFNTFGSVDLYYGGGKKFETTDSGVNITGNLISNTIVRSNATDHSGEYGSATQIPILTIDSSGFIDSIGEVLVAGVTGLVYDSATGNLTISTADGGSFSDSINLSPFTTDNLSEGSNLYYTDARVRNALSASGDLSYDQGTGQFSIDVENVYTKANFDSDLGAALDGGTGITYDSSTDTISITDTGVIAATYGSASQIPVFTVNAQGQLDSAGSVAVAGVTNLVYDSSNGAITISTADGGSFTDSINLNPFSTTDLSEGSNLYYTTVRSDSDFDIRLATKSTSNLSEGTNLYYTTVRVDSDIDTAFVAKSTDNLSEGSTNLYYTSARADSDAKNAISVTDNGGDGSISYTPATGVISYTGPSASEVRAHFSGGTGVTITDGSVAIGQSVGTTDDVTFGAVTGDSAIFGEVAFNTSFHDSHIGFQEGALWYDPHHKNLNYYTDFDHPIEIGMQIIERVYNNNGYQINKGQPLYYSGNRTDEAGRESPTVSLANATSATKYNVQGLAAENIPDGAYGQIVVAGVIEGFDTSSLTAGLNFFAGLTDGAVQNAPPTYPNYPMCLGWVIKSDANDGKVIINQQNHSVNSFRVQGDTHISSDLRVDGDLIVVGTQTITSTANVEIGGNIQYLNAGDTIGEAGTTFVGTGLDDAFFAGHYSGDSSNKSFFVKIDATGGTDTFEWGFDSSVGTEATGIAITGDAQLLDSNYGIKIDFGATTGHTTGDKWTGTATATDIDTGFFTNRNTGDAGDGYTHIGLFFDVSENKWTFLNDYEPEPEAPINLSAPGLEYGTVKAASFEGNLTGAVTGNAATATTATNVTSTANNTNNETVFLTFVDGQTGAQGIETDLQLTYNPSTNTVTAGTFSGSGASLTSLNASNISSGTISDDRLPASITSDITGNAATATALATARNIDVTGVTATGVNFDGTGDIDIEVTAVPSSLLTGTISDDRLPASITSDITGNAATATALATGRTIDVTGVTATGQSFDGTGDIDIEVTAVPTSLLTGTIDANTLDGINSTSFLRSDAADTKTSGDLTFNDNVSAKFGTGGDLSIYHNSSNSYIDNTIGNLYIRDNGFGAIYLQPTSGENSGTFNANGAVELYHDNSKKFETTSTGATVTGTINADSATIGTQLNLKNGIIKNTGGSLFIQSTNASLDLYAGTSVNLVPGSTSSTKLYYSGSNLKLETTNTGVTITGTASATTFSGSGSDLSSLPAAELTGTIASARLPDLAVSDFAASAIVTEAEGLASSDNDTSLPTTAAVIDYVANNAGGTDSATVSAIITADVDNAFVDALNVNAATVTVASDGTNQYFDVAFVDGTGQQGIKKDSNLRFNPSTNTLLTQNINAQGTILVGSSTAAGHVLLDTAVVTSSSTSQFAGISVDKNQYGGAKYIISCSRSGERHITELLVTHDGTTAVATEYGTVTTNGILATYDVDIDGDNFRLLITLNAATSTTFRISAEFLET